MRVKHVPDSTTWNREIENYSSNPRLREKPEKNKKIIVLNFARSQIAMRRNRAEKFQSKKTGIHC